MTDNILHIFYNVLQAAEAIIIINHMILFRHTYSTGSTANFLGRQYKWNTSNGVQYSLGMSATSILLDLNMLADATHKLLKSQSNSCKQKLRLVTHENLITNVWYWSHVS